MKTVVGFLSYFPGCLDCRPHMQAWFLLHNLAAFVLQGEGRFTEVNFRCIHSGLFHVISIDDNANSRMLTELKNANSFRKQKIVRFFFFFCPILDLMIASVTINIR